MGYIVHPVRSCASRPMGGSFVRPVGAQLLILALVLIIVAGVGEASIATGSYTGNGTSRSITGMASGPEIVIVKGNLAQAAVVRTDTMGNSKEMWRARVLESNIITSLDSNGFTVGSDPRVNQDGATYYYVAMRATGVESETGSYTGDGTASQNISLPFSAMYVMVFPDAIREAVHRSLTMTTTHKFGFGTLTNGITNIGTNQFTVGSDLNASAVTYHYVAFEPVAGKMSMGVYLGNDYDDRQITGLGVQPVYVVIQGSSSRSAHRALPVMGDSTLSFAAEVNYANGIQALLTDGFEVGSRPRINKDLQFCHYIAFGGSYTAVRLGALSATGGEDQVLIKWDTEAEINTAGFNVLRSESAAGPWVRLNQVLIPSNGNSWAGGSYTFVDEERVPGAVRWYCIEEVDAEGGTTQYPAQLVWDDGLADEDGDGMPDAWERPLGIDSGSEDDAKGDADGDGVPNFAEYLAGTSPVDPEDAPRLRIGCPDAEGLPCLTWRGRAGRMYTVQAGDSLEELLGGSGATVCRFHANGDQPFQLEDLPGLSERMKFYRLMVSPPE